jgi:hypothetical protein
MPTLRGHKIPDTEIEAQSSSDWRLMPVYLVWLRQLNKLLAPNTASKDFEQNPCRFKGDWTLAVVRGNRIQVTYCTAGLVAGRSYESNFVV